MLFFIYLDTRL